MGFARVSSNLILVGVIFNCLHFSYFYKYSTVSNIKYDKVGRVVKALDCLIQWVLPREFESHPCRHNFKLPPFFLILQIFNCLQCQIWHGGRVVKGLDFLIQLPQFFLILQIFNCLHPQIWQGGRVVKALDCLIQWALPAWVRISSLSV